MWIIQGSQDQGRPHFYAITGEGTSSTFVNFSLVYINMYTGISIAHHDRLRLDLLRLSAFLPYLIHLSSVTLRCKNIVYKTCNT
jgi:hypothetical protein